MVKSIVAFIAASAAGASQEPPSCWPLVPELVPDCPKGWTKEKEVKYQEDEAQRKQAVSHTLKSLLEWGKTELVATGNNLKEGLKKLQESEEIAEAIKGPPTNCDEEEDDLDFDLLARAAPHFKDLDIEGMKSKFQAIDKSDDKKMHELLAIFTDANLALRRIQGSLSTLPNTIKITNLSPLKNDAGFISKMTEGDTSDFVRSLFHEYACRIGMDKAAADAAWVSTNKWATLKKTNGKMIQKYEAALKVVEGYGNQLADAIESTNTKMEKLISEGPVSRFSPGGADEDEVHV